MHHWLESSSASVGNFEGIIPPQTRICWRWLRVIYLESRCWRGCNFGIGARKRWKCRSIGLECFLRALRDCTGRFLGEYCVMRRFLGQSLVIISDAFLGFLRFLRCVHKRRIFLVIRRHDLTEFVQLIQMST